MINESVVKKVVDDTALDADMQTKLASVGFKGGPRSDVTVGDMMDRHMRLRFEENYGSDWKSTIEGKWVKS